MRAGWAASDEPRPNAAFFAALNQAPKAGLAAFGIENRPAGPEPERLFGRGRPPEGISGWANNAQDTAGLGCGRPPEGEGGFGAIE